MQSWGERARWSVRDTAPEPTKSGVVGLLACAQGLNQDDALRELSRQIRIGVRCDRPGIPLVDYHTVVGGVMSAEGKIKKNANTGEPETVVSWRHYLCDASFLVAIQAAPDVIERLAHAAQNPIWPIYLGRKSCPPTQPVFAGMGEYPSLKAALQSVPLEQSDPSSNKIQLRAIIECNPGDENAVRRRDEVDSHTRRTFGPRYTQEIPLVVLIKLENGG
jgi:CRISPR system Cascade subunit CasD